MWIVCIKYEDIFYEKQNENRMSSAEVFIVALRVKPEKNKTKKKKKKKKNNKKKKTTKKTKQKKNKTTKTYRLSRAQGRI